MYLAFNLKTAEKYRHWFTRGKRIYDNQKITIKNNLSNYLYNGTNTINGNSLESDWFPQLNDIDVFLSHSHRDEEDVIAFAGWLNDVFGLTVFIDSCIWGNSEELLKLIDDRYCFDDKRGFYDYNLRNYSTSHVHMMLSMALTKMIDRSEIVIFFESENSVQRISKESFDVTKSPWIYSELVMTNLIRRKKPNRSHSTLIEKRAYVEANSLDIAYDVTEYLNKLLPLKKENLDLWIKQEMEFGKRIHSLDLLYAQYRNSDEVLLG
ncbi:hypothetical protein [Exiguobacterium sp. s133]|uniref:hypothetical protein n=1 Tax=Exiguobacterium sp. s133 TaxID=2751213 RepID=UPI001BEB22D9|nr:hypothetical protein [Exiguobacterium sp. s133]